MKYDLTQLSFRELMGPVASASGMLARLDERVCCSDVGSGWLARSHFTDACASLWVDGELVHLEDLVLHDAGMGVRGPSHELTIAADVLRTRRRIMANAPKWALSDRDNVDHLLRGDNAGGPLETKSWLDVDDAAHHDPFASELAAIDAVLARSEALLASARGTATGVPMIRDVSVYEPDWNEAERFGYWRRCMTDIDELPPVLQAALLLDAWSEMQVLQHAPWLGRLLVSAVLREAGLTANYLLPISTGLKQVQRQRRTHRNRDIRLLAFIEAMQYAAELGLKEVDRLLLSRQQMDHKLIGRRRSSKLPQLIDLVLSRPMVSTAMIVETLSVTPQGALKMAGELNLRELTGRGRFRAWGVL